MSSDNVVTVVGNATRDVQLKYTRGGQGVAEFGLAVNRRVYGEGRDKPKEETSFFDVTCWGTLAENVAETVARGDRVIVTGRLEQRSWETQQGDRRSKVELVADDVGPSLRFAVAEVTRNERTAARR